ncbi:MAG: hypothetical protein COY40_01015 [Alphaproteobacteria bacterium CG_4_10_14_0_8_um_filter_53_9]|nr:MAG: hypothetical protein COY40_01015 [Alphaproteobacteria bacterium CG_4_10_14_0_8_um_filter_53_9]
MNTPWMAFALVSFVAPSVLALESAGEAMMRQEAYKPLNIKAGSFLVAPAVDAEVMYNDNIFASETNEKSDFVTTVRPSVAVKSNWNRHALNARAILEQNDYADNNDESHTNAFAGVDGKVDVLRGTALGGGVSWQRAHEERTSPNSASASDKPIPYEVLTATAGAYRDVGLVNARFDTRVEAYDYDNTYTRTGGLLNNDGRDRNEFTQTLRLGYKAGAHNEIFIKADLNTRAYDHKGAGANINRSSHGRRVVAGYRFDITGKTAGDIYAGLMNRRYVDPAFNDIGNTLTYGGNVQWNASGLTTLKARTNRSIEETTTAATSGYVATTYSVSAEHAVRRNVLMEGNMAYETNDYESTAVARKDTLYTAGLGATYLINRNLKAKLAYDFTRRDSNVAGGDYDRNRVMVVFSAAF